MRRTLTWTWILILCLSTVPVQSQYHSQSPPCDPKAAKVINLGFFLHKTIGGKNQTAVTVAQANITSNDNNNNNNSPVVSFGSVVAIDDPLSIGPEHNSEVIGYAQGLGVMAGKNTTVVVLYLDFGFITGKFKGSSVSIFSRNPTTEKERELSVVGGRGKFRKAKGFAQLNTSFLNDTTVIVDYNVSDCDSLLKTTSETQFCWIM